MNDLDSRIRAFVGELVDAAPIAPPFPAVDASPSPRESPKRRRVLVLIAAVFLVGGISALVLVLRHPARRVQVNHAPTDTTTKFAPPSAGSALTFREVLESIPYGSSTDSSVVPRAGALGSCEGGRVVTAPTAQAADREIILADWQKSACYAVGPVLLTGENIGSAEPVSNPTIGGWEVKVHFDNDDFVTKVASIEINKQVAIVFDGVVQAAPTINAGIAGNDITISGGFDETRARNLAAQLDASRATRTSTPPSTTPKNSTGMSMHIEPTRLALGDTVHIRGAGCLGSGRPGDRVQLLLGNLDHPDLLVDLSSRSTTIASDGSFRADATVPDDAVPGTDEVVARCFGSSGTRELAVAPAVAVTVQSPYVASLSPTNVAAGHDISFHGSCPGQAPYDWLEVEFVPAPEPGSPPRRTGSFVLKGGLNGGTATVPRTTRPGTYHATARCEEERGLRPLRYFQPIDVVVKG